MAEINGDVQIDFWIENAQGERITSGSDVIYLGNFEEKKEATKIFLPKDVESGIYRFFVQVAFGSYSVSSHRTIEIEVGEELAEISGVEKGISLPVIIGIIVLILLLYRSKIQGRKMKKREELHRALAMVKEKMKPKRSVLGLKGVLGAIRTEKGKVIKPKAGPSLSEFIEKLSTGFRPEKPKIPIIQQEMKTPAEEATEKAGEKKTKMDGEIDTKEELDEILDRMEKRKKSRDKINKKPDAKY